MTRALTQQDVSGPGVSQPEGLFDYGDLASFRLLFYYQPGSDQCVLRLDVKVDDLQHGCAMFATESVAVPGARIMPIDPLIEPKGGVLKAAAVQTNRLRLAEVLHNLAAKLELAR